MAAVEHHLSADLLVGLLRRFALATTLLMRRLVDQLVAFEKARDLRVDDFLLRVAPHGLLAVILSIKGAVALPLARGTCRVGPLL